MISKRDLRELVDYEVEQEFGTSTNWKAGTGNSDGLHEDELAEIWAEKQIEQAIENRGFWDASEQEHYERNCR